MKKKSIRDLTLIRKIRQSRIEVEKDKRISSIWNNIYFLVI